MTCISISKVKKKEILNPTKKNLGTIRKCKPSMYSMWMLYVKQNQQGTIYTCGYHSIQTDLWNFIDIHLLRKAQEELTLYEWESQGCCSASLAVGRLFGLISSKYFKKSMKPESEICRWCSNDDSSGTIYSSWFVSCCMIRVIVATMKTFETKLWTYRVRNRFEEKEDAKPI